jgi:hypothetical protein
LEKNTQKCALRVHFTVRIKFSLLGDVRIKIDLFDQKYFSKKAPNHPNNAHINSKFVGIFSPPRIRHFGEHSGVLL